MNRKIKTLFVGGAVVAAMAVGSTAEAAVTFDPATGTGFVGKGDVQLAFGWSNKQAQTNATDVRFAYSAIDVYDVTCEWDTVTGGKESKTIHHAVTNERTISLASSVAYETRRQNQYTGYALTGFTAASDAASVPAVGDSCPMGSGTAVVTLVEEDVEAGEEGDLTITFGEVTVALPNTPVTVTQ